MSKRVHFNKEKQVRVFRSELNGRTYVNCNRSNVIHLKFDNDSIQVCYTRGELQDLLSDIETSGLIRVDIGKRFPKPLKLTQEHYNQINKFLSSPNQDLNQKLDLDSDSDSGLSIHDSDFSFSEDEKSYNLIYETNFDLNDVTIFMDLHSLFETIDIPTFIRHVQNYDDELTTQFKKYLKEKEDQNFDLFSELSLNGDDVSDLAKQLGGNSFSLGYNK
jgi:hypothetical protein